MFLSFNYILSQFFGVIGLIFTVIAFQKKERRSILHMQMIGTFFFCLNFLFLSAYTGALMSLVVVIRNFIFEHYKQHLSILIFFVFLLLGITFLSWQGVISTLPIIGTLLATYGMWQKKPFVVRVFLLVATLIWLPYSLFFHSYTAFITQMVVSLSIFIGLVRFDRSNIERFFH